MPAIVGAVKVINVGGSGVFNIGDVFTITPYSAVKTFAGAGSFNTGDFIKVKSNYSSTNTYDMDVVDSSISPIEY